MSSSFRRSVAVVVTVAAVAAVAGVGAAFAQRTDTRRMQQPPPSGPAPDDSSMKAAGLLGGARRAYGYPDTWGGLQGVRYYITYRIPGPDGALVQEWSEAHYVWLKESPRVRIDNSTDSTLILVHGDTTKVRRGGVWSADSLVLAAGRQQAMDARWLLQMPYNLFDNALKRRIERGPTDADPSMVIRVEYGSGQDRPAGTRVRILFAANTWVVRSVQWYDPRSRGWFLLELANEKSRYGWTWAENRTLRSSDSEGTAGPIVWTAVVQDMQLESRMPVEVLSPPGLGAPADSSAAPPGVSGGAR